MSNLGFEANINNKVRAEKLQLLFKHSYTAVFINVLMASLLTAALWSGQNHKLLITWLSLVTASSVLRLALFVSYRRKKPSCEETLAWEKPYFLTLVLSCLIWGIGSLYLISGVSTYYQLIITFFLMGMAGGAIASYWAHRLFTLLTVATIISPVVIWISLQSTETAPLISVGGCALVLFACLIRSSKVLERAVNDSLLKNHELEKEKRKVEYLARKDELTNLYNRRAFYEQLNEIGGYCQRHNEAIAIVLADVDNFKDINDTHGHMAGDLALASVGKTFKQQTRTSDICARLGGEEFGILIRASDLEEAGILAEKLRVAIASKPVEFENKSFNLTASFGVACGSTDFGNVVKNADKAMYRAKQEGRNKVVKSTPVITE